MITRVSREHVRKQGFAAVKLLFVMTCSPPPPTLYTVVSAESFGEEEDEEEEEESDLEGTAPIYP